MTKDWKTRTRLVHEGSRRSQYGEMAEAIFLTQGFVYPDAETAESRFVKAGDDEFIYARYGNPTTRMFEERIAGLEGTEDAFATASGMAAVSGALMSRSTAKFQASACAHTWQSTSTACGSPISSLRRTTNRLSRRRHWPSTVLGSQEARTTTGRAGGHSRRRPVKTV